MFHKRPLQDFLFRNSYLYLRNDVFAFVLAPGWKTILRDLKYNPHKIFVTPNGTDRQQFTFRETPLYPDRSIYLGTVKVRKRQHLYQTIESLDIVGPCEEPEFFDRTNKNYLGHWTRDRLHKHLSDYANMVNLGSAEIGAPLVILEALLCGLGVVVSEVASGNLDTTLPWISVIPEEKIMDLQFVEAEIARNREISLRHRRQIREYAINNFSWEKLVPRYADLCLQLHANSADAPKSFDFASLRVLLRFLPLLLAYRLYLCCRFIYGHSPLLRPLVHKVRALRRR